MVAGSRPVVRFVAPIPRVGSGCALGLAARPDRDRRRAQARVEHSGAEPAVDDGHGTHATVSAETLQNRPVLALCGSLGSVGCPPVLPVPNLAQRPRIPWAWSGSDGFLGEVIRQRERGIHSPYRRRPAPRRPRWSCPTNGWIGSDRPGCPSGGCFQTARPRQHDGYGAGLCRAAGGDDRTRSSGAGGLSGVKIRERGDILIRVSESP
jgi:hypothetical protein